MKKIHSQLLLSFHYLKPSLLRLHKMEMHVRIRRHHGRFVFRRGGFFSRPLSCFWFQCLFLAWEKRCWSWRFLRWPPRIFGSKWNSLGEKCKINKNTRSQSFKVRGELWLFSSNVWLLCFFRPLFLFFCFFLVLFDTLLQASCMSEKKTTKKITFTH